MISQSQTVDSLIERIEKLEKESEGLKKNEKELINTIKLKEKEIELIQLNNNRFLSIISHDLKGPIGSISGLSELLDKNFGKYEEKKKKHFINIFNKSLKSIYFLLENLLEWSKFKREDIKFLPQEIKLIDVVDEIININSELISNKKIRIKYNFNNIEKICVDPDMFKTVIRNLFSNALKYSFNNNDIIITAKKTSSNLIISVKDFGTGIDDEVLSCIFTFDKNCIQSGLNGETGSGLGLALCKEIVEAWNGKIWIESKPNVGSEFFVSIPL